MTWVLLLCCQESVDDLLERLTDERIEVRDAAQADLLALLRKEPTLRNRLSDEANATKHPEARDRLRSILARWLGAAPLTLHEEQGIDGILRTTPVLWEKMEEWKALEEALREAPKSVLKRLVDSLTDATLVHGLSSESQIYTVCGNALTLLEWITDREFDGGYDIHDHRGWKPERPIRLRWLAWWEDLREKPVEEVFEGLTYDQKERARKLLSREREAPAKMERKLVPYLILLTRNTRFALYTRSEQLRYCDAANRLLRLWTGQDFGEIAPRRWEDRSSEVRKSVERVHSQWSRWWEENRGREEWK